METTELTQIQLFALSKLSLAHVITKYKDFQALIENIETFDEEMVIAIQQTLIEFDEAVKFVESNCDKLASFAHRDQLQMLLEIYKNVDKPRNEWPI